MASMTTWAVGISVALGLVACGNSATDSAVPIAETTAAPLDPGALVKMEMASKVGVLLDEIPDGPQREAAAAEALAKSTAFWTERAKKQTKLTYYKLVFRKLYYAGSWSKSKQPAGKGPLPLPPGEVWTVTLNGSPKREKINGHDIITVDYSFSTHILTDVQSPGIVEPSLGKIGQSYDEPFTLPIDPELLLERTGYACMDEDEYPPGSVFEENTWYFYDDSCKVESPSAPTCHLTQFPKESCAESLTRHVGSVNASMHFTRVPWSNATANAVRVSNVTNQNGADLHVVKDDMVNERRVVYRFFAPGSCELEEGVISKLGWRRLLMFSATVENLGTGPIHIGSVVNLDSPWQQNHVFEYSACHHHYHFSHYGIFGYGGAPGSKRAFCLEDTNRFRNDERTVLMATHQSCNYQGITEGWGDEYEFGIPGQWVDITDVDTSVPHDLTFNSNPDKFLCEGTPVLDANGVQTFSPSEFTDKDGNVVGRPNCDMPANWHDNNFGSVSVDVGPKGSYVTDACTRGQIGPNRNCGFRDQNVLKSCTPGSTVTLSCTASGTPQILRVCERSDALGTGVACSLADSTVNLAITPGAAVPVVFACPAVRDAAGTGGYSLYDAPVLPSQPGGGVTCN
jgi:hypothetical protein